MFRVAEQVDPDLLGLADWLAGAAADAGVRITLGSTVGAEDLSSTDVLVWAAGAEWSHRRHVALAGGWTADGAR